MHTMDTAMPFSPNTEIAKMVAILVAIIFTNILPINITANVRLGDDKSFVMVLWADGWLDCIFFFWKPEREKSAVSEPEKNADNMSRIINNSIVNIV